MGLTLEEFITLLMKAGNILGKNPRSIIELYDIAVWANDNGLWTLNADGARESMAQLELAEKQQALALSQAEVAKLQEELS